MRKQFAAICTVLLCVLAPAQAWATFQFLGSISPSSTSQLSVGSTVTIKVAVTNSGSSSQGGLGSATISIPDVFTVGTESGCTHITYASHTGSNWIYNWSQIPDNGSPLAPGQTTAPTCNFPLTLNSIPSGSVFAKIQFVAGGTNPQTGTYTFNIAAPAPTFTKALTAAASAQSITLAFGASNATSCTGTSTPAVSGWANATICSTASACANYSKTFSNLSAGNYSFTAKCTGSGGSKSSSATATIGAAAVDLSAALAAATGVAPPPYTAGAKVSLLFTIKNASTAAASGVTATFQVLNSAALANMTSDFCGAAASGKIAWNIGNLAAGQSRTCTISGNVASAAAPINLSATVISPDVDVNPANNTSTLILPTYQPPAAKSKTVSGNATTKDSTHVAMNNDGSKVVFQSKETDLVASNHQIANGQDVYSVGTDGKAKLENIDANGQLPGTSSLPSISHDGSIVAFSYTPSTSNQGEVITGQIFAGGDGAPKHRVDGGANQPASGAPSVSAGASAKRIVFCSAATNLVSQDTNGQRDIFLGDPLNPGQALQRISTGDNDEQLQGDSCEPSISADGTKVVFTLSSMSRFGTAARQVVRKNLVTHKLEVISRSASGAYANGDSFEPTINANGAVIAFTSKASNLDTLTTTVGGKEVFVSVAQSSIDGAARYLRRARSGDGNVPNGGSQHPHLSQDGTILVMQTAATNFFAGATAVHGIDAMTAAAAGSSSPPSCGSVVITTNYFVPGQVGQCSGSSSNQNPVISGDGTATGFDSNVPQSNSPGSSNYNTYEQGLAGKNVFGYSNFNGDFSGQWYDPNQSGQGLVLDVVKPDPSGNRSLLLTWFVYLNGHPTWLEGVGQLHAGSGSQSGTVVADMQLGISKSTGFPIGNGPAVPVLWGTLSIVFADADTATMSWTSTYPGFNSGSMALKHLVPVSLPETDVAGSIKACYSGPWNSTNPQQNGQGFEIEVVPTSPPLLSIDWFAYSPADGSAFWLAGVGPISNNTAQVELQLIDGPGAQFPPRFNPDPTQSIHKKWGTATFTFLDSAHASVSWVPELSGYAAGSMNLHPVIEPEFLDRRACN